MTITDEAVQLDSAAHTTIATEHAAEDTQPRVRPSKRNIAAIGAAIVVAAGLAVAAVQITGSTRSDGTPVPASPSDDVIRDLVDRGVVPAATLGDGSQITSGDARPTSQSHDEFVRDLVARGLVPAATLDDGSQITSGDARPTSQSHDEFVRDLVARGLVPAATLDDGSQITSGDARPTSQSHDEFVRDLVARGLVPAATLDDGSEVRG